MLPLPKYVLPYYYSEKRYDLKYTSVSQTRHETIKQQQIVSPLPGMETLEESLESLLISLKALLIYCHNPQRTPGKRTESICRDSTLEVLLSVARKLDNLNYNTTQVLSNEIEANSEFGKHAREVTSKIIHQILPCLLFDSLAQTSTVI